MGKARVRIKNTEDRITKNLIQPQVQNARCVMHDACGFPIIVLGNDAWLQIPNHRRLASLEDNVFLITTFGNGV